MIPNCEKCQQPIVQSQWDNPSVSNKLNHLAIWNTNRCDLRCAYCFVFQREATQPDIDINDKVIEALPAFYEKHCDLSKQVMVYFFGGEPMMAFDKVKQVYERLKSYNILWSMTSNLTLIHEEEAAWMGERGFRVHCSIDGIEAANIARKYPNGQNSWKEAIKGLGMVRKHLTASPELRATVTPSTVKYVYDSVMFFVEQGINFMAVEPAYETEWSKADIDDLMDQYAKVAKFMVHNRNREFSFKPINDVKHLLDAQGRKDQPDFWKTRCGLGQTGVAVDTDGSIYGCHHFVCNHRPQEKIGDVFTGIDEVARTGFANAMTAQRPRNATDPDKCKHCSVERNCMGGCIATNVDLFDQGYLVPDSYCDIQNAQVRSLVNYAIDLNNTLVPKVTGMKSLS